MSKSTVKTNFIYQTVYQVIMLVTPLALSPYVSRVLGPEGIGAYSYTYSVAYFFVIVSMLGILDYGSREIAKCRDDIDRLSLKFSEIFFVHFLVSVIVLVIYFVYIVLTYSDSAYSFTQIFYVGSAIFDISWFYYGIEEMRFTVIINALIKLVTTLLVFIMVKDGSDILVYCLIFSLGTLVNQMLLWLPIRKYVRFVWPQISGRKIGCYLESLIVLFVPAFAISIYNYMDKIMIAKLSNQAEVGYYDNSFGLASTSIVIAGALGTVMLPQMSHITYTGERQKGKYLFQKSVRYVMLATFGVTAGIMAVAPTFAPTFWGNEFSEISTTIRILSCAIPFMAFANIVRTQYLLPNGLDRAFLLSVVIGAIINIVLNFIFIPKWGAEGAAVATLVTNIEVCVYQTIVANKELKIRENLIDIIPFAVLAVFMFVVVSEENDLLFGISDAIILAIQVGTGVVIYCCGALGILRAKGDKLLNINLLGAREKK